MTGHFSAFSFVDQIVEDASGERITGVYHIPTSLPSFPLSLVSEAIGQLAAWSAMAVVGFRYRPVAGIAGGVEFLGEVRPGDVLTLEATLSRADEEAVTYDGQASVAGQPVVRLRECLGPMVPMDDFDASDLVAARYDLLVGEGAKPGVFPGIPALPYERTGGIAGESVEGNFSVPSEATFFQDHFRLKPVFPGTLLMEVNLRVVSDLLSERPDQGEWRVVGTKNVKLRSFMPPGDVLTMEARVETETDKAMEILVQTKKGRRLNSSALVILAK